MTDADILQRRIDDVLAFHIPVMGQHKYRDAPVCEVCSDWIDDYGYMGDKFPCQTVRILTGAISEGVVIDVSELNSDLVATTVVRRS